MGGTGTLSELEWNRFNDGFPNLQINKDDAQRLEKFYGTCLIVSFHTPEVIFEQLSLLYALPRLRARNFRIILPWFSTGTMERVEQVLVELKSAVWLLKERLMKLKIENPDEEIAIAFPDDGAHKRFKSKFKDMPHIICTKVRNGDVRFVSIKEGEPKGRHVIIVDDLVQSGGTLLECAKPLMDMGATKVSCFVTHGVFPKESWNKFVGNDLIHKFWLTDSIPTTCSQIKDQAPFEVLSLAPLISNYLAGLAED